MSRSLEYTTHLPKHVTVWQATLTTEPKTVRPAIIVATPVQVALPAQLVIPLLRESELQMLVVNALVKIISTMICSP